jgi:hypothetical protein
MATDGVIYIMVRCSLPPSSLSFSPPCMPSSTRPPLSSAKRLCAHRTSLLIKPHSQVACSKFKSRCALFLKPSRNPLKRLSLCSRLQVTGLLSLFKTSLQVLLQTRVSGTQASNKIPSMVLAFKIPLPRYHLGPRLSRGL